MTHCDIYISRNDAIRIVKPIGDKMRFLRRFWLKTKLFSTVIWRGLEEGQMRKAQWYLKNHTYID
jgi:hypothetical protein